MNTTEIPLNILRTFKTHRWVLKQLEQYRKETKHITPSWCYVLGDCINDSADRYLENESNPSSNDLTKLYHSMHLFNMLSAWNVTKGVYHFDNDFVDELTKTSYLNELPTDILKYLSEWCVYIVLKREINGVYYEGFFATISHCARDNISYMVVGLVVDNKEAPRINVYCLGKTIKDSFLAKRKEYEDIVNNTNNLFQQVHYIKMLEECEEKEEHRIALGEFLIPLILYLCVDRPDIQHSVDLSLSPQKPRPIKNKKHGSVTPSAKNVNVWNVGFRIGQVLRKPRKVNESDCISTGKGKPMPPHVRRAHWRHQRYGVGNSLIKLKWIHPMLINMDKDDMLATIYPVKEAV